MVQKLPLSIPSEFIRSERIIGFTVPVGGSFLICDHDEVWRVQTRPFIVISPTLDDPYTVANRIDFLGWGKEDAVPVLHCSYFTVSYDFTPSANSVEVKCASAHEAITINFPTFSGDWFATSLSREGDLLVLAEPYRIDLYGMS